MARACRSPQKSPHDFNLFLLCSAAVESNVNILQWTNFFFLLSHQLKKVFTDTNEEPSK